MLITCALLISTKSAVAEGLAETYWWSSDMGIYFNLSSGDSMSVCNSSKPLKGSWKGSSDNLTLNIPELDGSVSTFTGNVKGTVMQGMYKHQKYPKRHIRAFTDNRSGAYKREYEICLSKK